MPWKERLPGGVAALYWYRAMVGSGAHLVVVRCAGRDAIVSWAPHADYEMGKEPMPKALAPTAPYLLVSLDARGGVTRKLMVDPNRCVVGTPWEGDLGSVETSQLTPEPVAP